MRIECYPEGVEPYAKGTEAGRFLVQSKSRPKVKHLCCVLSLKCGCEKWQTKCSPFKHKNGYLPYDMFCPHLKLAIAYWGMMHAEVYIRQNLAR